MTQHDNLVALEQTSLDEQPKTELIPEICPHVTEAKVREGIPVQVTGTLTVSF